MNPVRGSNKWSRPPGGLDALHLAHLFDTDNDLGFPTIGNAVHLQPPHLWPYHARTESQQIQAGAVHFYLDDYQFETAWHRPNRALSKVSKFKYAITPDFSIWSHWPKTLQYFNLYRSRWCGAYWLSHGLTVIPCVSWADPPWDYYFLGIIPHSTIAISTVGIKEQAHHVAGLLL